MVFLYQEVLFQEVKIISEYLIGKLDIIDRINLNFLKAIEFENYSPKIF